MQKLYSRIEWQNEPSTKTPINETNLNKMDSTIDKLDDRIIDMDTRLQHNYLGIDNVKFARNENSTTVNADGLTYESSRQSVSVGADGFSHSSMYGNATLKYNTLTVDYQGNTATFNATAGASKVNGHTVDKDVPSDAVFTDTTYTESRGIAIADDVVKLADFCTTINDWNDAVTTGWYMSSTTINAPTSTAGWWHYGEVIAHNTNYVRQIVYQFSSDAGTNITANTYSHNRYERVKNGGVWGAWVNTTVKSAVEHLQSENALVSDANGHVVSSNVTAAELGMLAGVTSNIQEQINSVFQSVSEGKTLIASAITDKGIQTDADATFKQMADNISSISGGNNNVSNAFSANVSNDTINIQSKVQLAGILSKDLIEFPLQITQVERIDDTNFSVSGDFSEFEVFETKTLKTAPGFLFDASLSSTNAITRVTGKSLVPVMSANQQDGYVASCSDSIDAVSGTGRVAFRAFDGETTFNGHEWHSDSAGFPHWLQIELPAEKHLQKVIITNRLLISGNVNGFNLGTNPNHIEVMASNNGTDFVALKSLVCKNAGNEEINTFNVDSGVPYRYYRFNFTDNHLPATHTYVTVGELELIGY